MVKKAIKRRFTNNGLLTHSLNITLAQQICMNSRNPREKAIDNLILLYGINEANKEGKITGITHLMKIVFKSELKLQSNRIKAFNYPFIRYHYGPFSPELSFEDYNGLVEDGFIEQNSIKLTHKAKEILKEMSPSYAISVGSALKGLDLA